jgi:Pyruvate/2-oxoacid:ferredoxin oxidoreductase delta subunit
MLKMKLPSFIMNPSTRAFTLEARRVRGYSLFDWLHGIVYARWLYLYIDIGTGEHTLVKRYGPLISKLLGLIKPRNIVTDADELEILDGENSDGRVTFADTYHGKVMPIDNAKQLVTVNEDIQLADLEHIIPYRKARDIILQNPDHIVVLDCPCRVSRPDPCLPLDVCLIVGEPFASFVVEHHPERSRWINQGEAVQILVDEEERGHVHHAFFKDAMLERFYAICNCCECCCGAMQSHRNGTPMLASSGYVAFVDDTLCIGCGACEVYCQFGAISVSNGGSVGIASVDVAACMGCGVCTTKCEQGAVELVRDESKGIPLELFELMGIES